MRPRLLHEATPTIYAYMREACSVHMRYKEMLCAMRSGQSESQQSQAGQCSHI